MNEGSSHFSQLELAQMAVKGSNVKLAEEVLHRAQNGPPHGEGDGTISEAQWYALRDWINARKAASVAQRVAEDLLLGNPDAR